MAQDCERLGSELVFGVMNPAAEPAVDPRKDARKLLRCLLWVHRLVLVTQNLSSTPMYWPPNRTDCVGSRSFRDLAN
jgi:hypothetical protein